MFMPSLSIIDNSCKTQCQQYNEWIYNCIFVLYNAKKIQNEGEGNCIIAQRNLEMLKWILLYLINIKLKLTNLINIKILQSPDTKKDRLYNYILYDRYGFKCIYRKVSHFFQWMQTK